MQITEIYAQYQVMPQLATHMLRVAGIVKRITDGWADRESAEKSIKACLLHDLGNMAKFDLTRRVTPIADLALWQERQKTFWARYGREAHEATYRILQELGLTSYIAYLKAEARMYEQDPTVEDFRLIPLPSLLVLYADLRVSIHGVVSLDARIADLTERYGAPRPEARWGKLLEEYVQGLTPIDVTKITEASVTPLFDELLRYNIEI